MPKTVKRVKWLIKENCKISSKSPFSYELRAYENETPHFPFVIPRNGRPCARRHQNPGYAVGRCRGKTCFHYGEAKPEIGPSISNLENDN